MVSADEIARAGVGALVLGGWVLLSGFGIVLYMSMRGLPKEVVGARLFLNLDKVGHGFLFLSVAFAVILLAALPMGLGVVGAVYVELAGSVGWIVSILLSMVYLFRSMYVPRSIRKKFGAPS